MTNQGRKDLCKEKESVMYEAMIEKAREQRPKALCHIRQKSLFGGLDRDPEIKNLFSFSDAALNANNVVVFRHHQIDGKSPNRSTRRLH